MQLPVLILVLCCVGFVLAGGCTASAPPEVTPTMEPTATQTLAATPPVPEPDTLCGELVYCGYIPAASDIEHGQIDQVR